MQRFYVTYDYIVIQKHTGMIIESDLTRDIIEMQRPGCPLEAEKNIQLHKGRPGCDCLVHVYYIGEIFS